MNTRTRGATATHTHIRFSVAATCCVALACAAAVYVALDPATTARENLDACVRERLALRGNEAASAKLSVVAVQATDHAAREQAFSAALYACSNQP